MHPYKPQSASQISNSSKSHGASLKAAYHRIAVLSQNRERLPLAGILRNIPVYAESRKTILRLISTLQGKERYCALAYIYLGYEERWHSPCLSETG